MAVNYVTLDNLGRALQRYDNIFKQYSDDKMKSYIRAITFDDQARKLKFYTVPAPVPAGTVPYLEVEIPDDLDIDTSNANGLGITGNGLKLDLAVAPDVSQSIAGSAGAMSASDKEKLDSATVATEAQIKALFD